MDELTVIRTARKRHWCNSESFACTTSIQPGDRYAYSSLPPHSEIGNETWWHHKTCAACAATFGRPLDAATPQPATPAKEPTNA